MVPAGWMPDVKMERIHLHWTAGNYRASSTDLAHYHILIEGPPEIRIVRGDPSISLNASPIKPGYAAHTLNANGAAIAVSLCGMRGAVESPFEPGPCPITRGQWDMMIQVCAELAQKYRISPLPQKILSHAEVHHNLGIAQRGKWDFTRLPFNPNLIGASMIGNQLREEIKAKLSLGVPPLTTPSTSASDSTRRPLATVTANVLNMRQQPSVTSRVVGSLGKGDKVEINRSVMNDDTEWLSVIVMDTREWAWIAARYVKRD